MVASDSPRRPLDTMQPASDPPDDLLQDRERSLTRDSRSSGSRDQDVRVVEDSLHQLRSSVTCNGGQGSPCRNCNALVNSTRRPNVPWPSSTLRIYRSGRDDALVRDAESPCRVLSVCDAGKKMSDDIAEEEDELQQLTVCIYHRRIGSGPRPVLPTFSMAGDDVADLALARGRWWRPGRCPPCRDLLGLVFRFSRRPRRPARCRALRPIGLAPAATFLRPSRTIACARHVAVVVRRTAASFVAVATSRTSCAPGSRMRPRPVDLRAW